MEITFRDARIQRLCNSEKEIKRKFGMANAKAIMRRLADLRAFQNLDDVLHAGYGGCHQLTADRKG
ncbi:MAG: hypothetical protein HY717_06150 [Planctomycetes bacterium]|nr:hypothetical protein [Planctomycetota bacterium]